MGKTPPLKSKPQLHQWEVKRTWAFIWPLLLGKSIPSSLGRQGAFLAQLCSQVFSWRRGFSLPLCQQLITAVPGPHPNFLLLLVSSCSHFNIRAFPHGTGTYTNQRRPRRKGGQNPPGARCQNPSHSSPQPCSPAWIPLINLQSPFSSAQDQSESHPIRTGWGLAPPSPGAAPVTEHQSLRWPQRMFPGTQLLAGKWGGWIPSSQSALELRNFVYSSSGCAN